MTSQKKLSQEAFVSRLEDRLAESGNKKLLKLDSEDLEDLIWLIFDELALSLQRGYRVIFDGWAEFFTNPVKRKCYDTSDVDWLKSGDRRPTKMTFAHRVRFKPTSEFRRQAETKLTESEYIAAHKEIDEVKEVNRLKHSQK